MGAIYCDNYLATGASVLEFPDERGVFSMNYLISMEAQPLPSDPVGIMTLRLTNVVPGSTYDVEARTTGEKILAGTAEASTVILTVPVYLSGDAKNDLRIKVRKASSAPYFQPYETQATAAVGTQSIFINQLPDE